MPDGQMDSQSVLVHSCDAKIVYSAKKNHTSTSWNFSDVCQQEELPPNNIVYFMALWVYHGGRQLTEARVVACGKSTMKLLLNEVN